MADACVDSAFAEVVQNGKVLDRFEDEKLLKDSEMAAVIGTGKGNVKGIGVVNEENGAQESKLQKDGKTEDSNGEEKKAEFSDDSRPEEPKILEKDEEKPKGRGRGRAKKVPPVEKVEVKKEAEKKGTETKKRPRKEPGTPILDRPARERKSIDRFAASTEKEKVREFKIEKGTGTVLKDIPNIVYKMSKKTGGDDSLQLLHKLLFGKRVKPHNAKQNILQFSGYVWGTNQDKERVKTKERLEKCVKESLLQVSELLDLSVKSSSKKEDVVATLLEFLESPHKTTDNLLEEKEKSKGKKRKRTPKKGAGKRTPGQTSRKRRKSEGSLTKKKVVLVDEEDEEEKEESIEEEEEDLEPEEPEKKKRHRKDSDDEEYNVKSKRPKKKTKGSRKKGVVDKADIEDPSSKDPEESEEEVKLKSPKKVSRKSSSKPTKASLQSPGKGATKSETASSKVFSRKKKKDDDQEEEEVKGNVKETPNKEKPSRERSTNKSSMKAEGKSRTKGKKAQPSDEELRSAICDLLKEADFSTVTFTDVVKQLERQFNIDLTEKKGHVKVLIREEISKIAEEDDGEDENAGEDVEGEKEESDPGDLADQAAEE